MLNDMIIEQYCELVYMFCFSKVTKCAEIVDQYLIMHIYIKLNPFILYVSKIALIDS